MSKIVWIVNKHLRPPEYETHLRYINYAKYLKELGYEVKLFCSSYQHQLDIDLIQDKKQYFEVNYDGLDYVVVKTISYKGNGLRRIYSLYQFTSKVIKYAKKAKKPDVIIHTSNTPFTNSLCSFAKRNKVKYIVEILDLWPESFVSFGLMSAKNPIMRVLYNMEKRLYEKADNIVFSMEGGADYIVDKKWDKQNNRGTVDLNKVLYINNSVELTDFNNSKTNHEFKAEWVNDNSIFKVVYIGSISLANDVIKLIEAAEYLRNESRIKFYIYGDGSERSKLETMSIDRSITNVFFMDKRIEYKYVPSLLSKSSLNILNFQQSDVERYGGCQGKLFNYIASGKPLCSNVKMGYCLINKYELGIAENFEAPKGYADAILSLSEMNETKYFEMCDRVSKVAEEFDFRIQAQKLLNIL